jgi:hypothetical protein
MHLRKVRRNLPVYFPTKILRETVTRRAAQPKQKSELPQGAWKSPEAVPEHETGHGMADTYRSKVFICVLVL